MTSVTSRPLAEKWFRNSFSEMVEGIFFTKILEESIMEVGA